MTKQTRLIIVRHGESEYNRQKLIGGHANPALTDKGRQQIKNTRDRLKSVKFDVICSSDLQRAFDTIEIIHGKPVPHSNRKSSLRERKFGQLEGKPVNHLDDFTKLAQTLSKDEAWKHKIVDDMESDHELSERYLEALGEIAQNHPGETVLIGSHGGAIRAVLMKLKDAGYAEFPHGSFNNGDYIELTYDNGHFEVIEVTIL